MTWDDVLKRDDIVGGDLETHEDEDIYRGPIESIELKDGIVYFDGPWAAKLIDGKWKKWPSFTTCFVRVESTPKDIGDGKIFFDMFLGDFGVIFPKREIKLDSSEVGG